MKTPEVVNQLKEGFDLFLDNNHWYPTAIILHPDKWTEMEDYLKIMVGMGLATFSSDKKINMYQGVRVYRSEDMDPDKILFK